MTFVASLIKGIVFALVVTLVQGIQAPAANATACTQYKIGYQGPLTGPEAATGLAQLSGVNLALQKFLAANPSSSNISSTVLQIDDQGDPSVAGPAVQTAVADDCLLAVVGPAYSGAATASLKWYEAKGIPVITPSASRPSLTSIYGPNVFNRLAPLSEELFTQMIPELVDSSGNGKVAYFYESGQASPTLSDFQPRNLDILWYLVSNTDISTIETKFAQAKAAGATQVVLDFYVFSTDLATVIQKAKSAGLGVTLSPKFDTESIEALLPNSNFDGIKLFTGSYRFKDLGSTLQSENSQIFAPLAFDATYFLLQGIKGGAVSRAQLSTFVRTQIFKGVTGEFGFGSNGEKVLGQLPRFQVSSNQLIPLGVSELKLNGNLTVVPRTSLTDNFKFVVSEWDGSDVDYQVYLYSTTVRNSIRQEAGTPTRIRLENGTHLIEAYPVSDPQSPRLRRQIYEVTVNGGAVSSVKNISSSPNSLLAISGDTYVLKLASQNTEISLESTENISGGTLVVRALNFGVKAVTYQKKLYFNLDASKTYEVDYYAPAESWKLAPLTTISNITLSGSTPYKIIVTPELANVVGSIDPMPTSGGSAQLLKDNGSGTFTVFATRPLSETGKTGFKVPAGSKVKIRFIPSDNQLGEVTTNEYTVPATGILETPAVAFSGQNVTGTISLAGGGVMANGWYEIIKTSVTPNSYVYDGSLSSTGQFAVRLAVGTYRIYVHPNSQPDYKEFSFECVVTDVNQSKVCNAEATRKKVVGTVTFSPSETIQNMSVQASTTTENYVAGSSVSSNGIFGLELDAGSYILSFTSWKFDYINNVDREYRYDRGYSTSCVVTSIPATCNVNLTNNFSYTISDHLGSSLKENALVAFRYRASPSVSIESLKLQQPLIQRFQLNDTENVSLPDGEHLMSIEKGVNNSWSQFANISYFLVKVSSGSVESVRLSDKRVTIT